LYFFTGLVWVIGIPFGPYLTIVPAVKTLTWHLSRNMVYVHVHTLILRVHVHVLDNFLRSCTLHIVWVH